jgi:ribosome-binding protein aMBF1 (putative translation factor)
MIATFAGRPHRSAYAGSPTSFCSRAGTSAANAAAGGGGSAGTAAGECDDVRAATVVPGPDECRLVLLKMPPTRATAKTAAAILTGVDTAVGDGAGFVVVGGGGWGSPQKRHFVAASWICSAQAGHAFIGEPFARRRPSYKRVTYESVFQKRHALDGVRMRPVQHTRVARDVGRRIAELRQAQELTQEQLAEKARVSIKYLQRVEAGRENLTLRSLVGLANLLRVAPIELLRAPASRTVRLGRPRKGTSKRA